MITFIVTTYNLPDWLLRRCLQSIVAQGLARDEYEIIVVDDESTISPQHVVDEFTFHADITLHIQKHARQGAARNLALDHARGQWIQFVDGDDYLLPGCMRAFLHIATSHKLDILMYGFRKVSCEELETCAISIPTSHLSEITTGDEHMLRHNLFGSCCTLLFRRSLCDDHFYGAPLRFTEHIYIEDEEFITKLTWRAQRMATTSIVAYAYYQRSGSTVHSISREHTDELFRNYFIVLHRLIDFEQSLMGTPHEGLTRKIRFLAIDILRRTLREPDWKERWQHSTNQLQTLNLFPIPQARYSCKYSLFRLMVPNKIGRHILRIIEKRQQS